MNFARVAAKEAMEDLLVDVLFQACIGGSALIFRFQRITIFCFRFFVHSKEAMDTLLR
jgi:hypothetical protein